MRKQHLPRFLQLTADAKSRVHEITIAELEQKLQASENFNLIDVCEEFEWKEGHLPTAIHIPRGIIESRIEKQFPDINAEIVVYCTGGYRGALVADNLQKMGYQHVRSLEGGKTSWIEAGKKLSFD